MKIIRALAYTLVTQLYIRYVFAKVKNVIEPISLISKLKKSKTSKSKERKLYVEEYNESQFGEMSNNNTYNKTGYDSDNVQNQRSHNRQRRLQKNKQGYNQNTNNNQNYNSSNSVSNK